MDIPTLRKLSQIPSVQVLAEVDADGINTAELARRIQRSGLRDLRSSKTPEASLAGALARDVIFCRVAPSTFALQAVVNYERCGPVTIKVRRAWVVVFASCCPPFGRGQRVDLPVFWL